MLAAILFAAAVAQTPQRSVALTFDDIPGVALPGSPCTSPELLIWNRKLLATLRARKAPALGLVVASRRCDDGIASVLNAWVDDGHDLGNHTWSHLDLNRASIELYEKDIAIGEPPIRTALARREKTLRYFRHPGLHAGDTAGKKLAIDRFLQARRYTVAPVTFDNQEWVFANAYASALQKNDDATARRVVAAYLDHINETVAFFERRSVAVLGREIPQILLLHMNAINADVLSDVLAILEKRGYRFITMDEAMRDAAYALPDTYVGKQGISWIHRWGLAKGMPVVMEPREPAWLRHGVGR
jgi:peptidoglycan/xylan/chitin deacetylase (PgdA/CDA1 family)